MRSYRPWIYWATVAMVSVFGTMAADVAHIVVGIPYLVSTVAFAVVVAAVLAIWHRTEGTLDVHSITTPRRETFYWVTVLATFALGTAAGDMTATTLHLGYLASGVLFAVAILFGLFQGGLVPSYAIIIRENFPANQAGGRTGVIMMMTLLGMALGGWMSGIIFDATGSYRAAFTNGVVWNGGNLLIALFLLSRTRIISPRSATAPHATSASG